MDAIFQIKISVLKAQPILTHSFHFVLALERTGEQIAHPNLLIVMKCCARINILKARSIQTFTTQRCGRHHKGSCHKRTVDVSLSFLPGFSVEEIQRNSPN